MSFAASQQIIDGYGPGLVALWDHYDTIAGQFVDRTGGGLHLTVSGTGNSAVDTIVPGNTSARSIAFTGAGQARASLASITAYPFTMLCFHRGNDNQQIPMSFMDSSQNFNGYLIKHAGTDAEAGAQDGGTFVFDRGGGTIGTDPVAITAKYTASGGGVEVECGIDSSFSGSPSTGAVAWQSPDRIAIGELTDGTPGNFYTGTIGLAAIWSRSLTGAELSEIVEILNAPPSGGSTTLGITPATYALTHNLTYPLTYGV